MITLVTFVIILPLCFPRELGALAWVSMAAVRLAPLSALLPALADLSLEQCSFGWISMEEYAVPQAEYLSGSSPALT